MQAYDDLGARNALEEGSLIRKPLLVSGHDMELMMDFLKEEGRVGGGEMDLCRSLAMHSHKMQLFLSQISHAL